MTEEEKQKAIAGLSDRAQRLLESVNNPMNYFVWRHKDDPKTMLELEKAGLVEARGRVTQMKRCWVPAGTQSFMVEGFPGETQTLVRRQHELPTKPGYYYCRDYLAEDYSEPVIREVIKTASGGFLVESGLKYYPITNYIWYGMVPVCKVVDE